MFHNPKMISVAKTLTLLWFLAIFGQENYHWPTFGHVGFNQNYKMLPKMQKFVQNPRRGFAPQQVFGQEWKPSLKWFLWPKTCLARGAKAFQVSELVLGQVLATFHRHEFFQKYQKFIKNTRFQKDFKKRLTAMKKCWPSGQMWWKSDAFGQHMFLWPRAGPLPYQTSRWPRLGHFYTQENLEKSKNDFKFTIIVFKIQEEALQLNRSLGKSENYL